jgi:hypothetical protein
MNAYNRFGAIYRMKPPIKASRRGGEESSS